MASKLGHNMIRSIEGGKKSDKSAEHEEAFKEAGLTDSAPETDKEFEDLDLDFYNEPSEAPQKNEGPEPVPVVEPAAKSAKQVKPAKRSKSPMPAKQSKSGGRLLSGAALTVALIALIGSGYVGFQQATGEVDVRQSIAGMKESMTELTFSNDEIASDLSDTQSVVQVNGSRIATIEQFGSDLQMLQTAINGIQDELVGIKSGLENQRKILDEHRLDIDNVDKQVKTLNERPPTRTIVKQVKAPAPQPQAAPTLDGATVASIDMWGSQPYVVLRDRDGGWIPLQTGDYYQGWRLQGAVGNEAIFKSGSKTRRMTVE